MLSQQDLKQIAQKGITQEQIENQLNEFKTGLPLHVSSMRISGTPIRLRASVW